MRHSVFKIMNSLRKTDEDPEKLLREIADTGIFPEIRMAGFSQKELIDIFNLEILHGGFAEYF